MTIFQYDFMIRAFIAGLVLAVAAPAVGIFLVTRRYSLLADTLAHVSLLGVALGALIKVNPLLTSVGTAMIAAMAIETLRERRNLFGESVLALFLSGSLALAVVVMALAKGFNAQLLNILFGSIATVTAEDVAVIAGVGAVVGALLIVLYPRLVLLAIDEDFARSSGASTTLLSLVLMGSAAVLIALAIRVVGVLLIGALMIIPVVTALQLRMNFLKTLWAAIVISVAAVSGGLVISFYWNVPSGGAIVLLALVIFALTTVATSRRVRRLWT